MIDTFYLEMEDESYKDEILLYKALLNKFSPIAINDVRIEGEIHINSTTLDVAKYFGSLETFEKNIEKRKSIAPVWEVALEKWIAQLEGDYLANEIHWDYDYTGEYTSGLRSKEPLIFQVYSDITEGNDKHIYNYIFGFIRETSDGNRYAAISRLEDVGFAVALAYFLPRLKSELKVLQETNISPSSIYVQQPKQKINWTGTPAQFGFIMDLLIQGGYFEKPTGSFEKDANFYLEHFSINTTKGTLTKELSERTNSIETKYRNNITIPHKDKLSKSESKAKVSGK